MSDTVADPKSRTLAIIAMTVAGASLLLSLIPFVAFAAVFLGPVGVVLGFVAWMRARKGRVEGQRLALGALIASLASILIALAVYGYLYSVLLGI